jgi:hypothetical protein
MLMPMSISMWQANTAPHCSLPTRPVLVALGLALGLHGLLLVWGRLALPPAPSAAQTPAATRLMWRWVAPPKVQNTPVADASLPRRTTRHSITTTTPAQRGQRSPGEPHPAWSNPVNPQLVGPASPSGAPGQEVDARSNPSEPAAAGSPLDLRLPTPSLRDTTTTSVRGQALNDVRSNTRAPSLEDHIAHATTRNDRLELEDRGLGRKRVRMNGRCVDVHQARISQIDPMNEVSARALPGLKACD